MIPHFRESAHEEAGLTAGDEGDEVIGEEDRNLDVLVKHAVRSTNWLEHDPKQVWQQLSARVRGPFGNLAIEQPANLGSSDMPYPEQYEKNEVKDTQPDIRRHSMYRLANEPYSLR
jgi:hypothetical protein